MTDDSVDPGASARTAHLISLGCAKNRVDSEVILGRLSRAGYRWVDDPAEAELLVVNTCGFIEAAREESVDTILEAARLKKKGRCRTLLVAGCLVQRYGAELAAELPEVDRFLGTAQLDHVLEVLAGGDRLLAEPGPSYLYDHTDERRPSLGSHTAYVKIAEGCDRPCAFCAVPAIRGPQRSRPVASVVAEVAALVHGPAAPVRSGDPARQVPGVREVTLVAQDLTAYGRDLGPPSVAPRLPDLVEALLAVDGLRWLRLLYAYPGDVDDRLIAQLVTPPVVPYLDLPIQHVHDGVLRLMRRGYAGQAVRDLLARLRGAVAGIHLRTSLLVGHPGETEEAFAALEAFVTEARFEHLGVFAYSPEPGTAACDAPGPPPGAVIPTPRQAAARAARLMEVQRAISREILRERYLDRELLVMLEGPSPESDYLRAARHAGQAPDVDGLVHVADVPGGLPPGTMAEVHVEQTADHDLIARYLRQAG